MLDDVKNKTAKRMAASVESVRNELAGVRTGRASLSLLDTVRVDYYGNPTPLNQVANLGVPEGNLLTVTPWDQTLLAEIEKAILKANLGLTPANDGRMIRIPVPPLTEERRKELAKRVNQLAEEGRTAVRNIRRDANEEAKKLEKDKACSQDDLSKGLKAIQELTDEHVGKIDDLAKGKEKEVLEL